MLKTADNIH